MSSSNSTCRYIRFADFTLDLQTRQLLRNGDNLSASDRIFDLLVLLSNTQVASKDEILEQLWPQQVVSDASLSRLISDTRQLLGESGKDQETIQTLRGKGFRLNPALTVHFESESEEVETSAETETEVEANRPIHKRGAIWAGVAVAVACSLLGALSLWLPKSTAPEASGRLVVLPVAVETGEDRDSWAQYGLMNLIIDQLANYPELQVADMGATLKSLTAINYNPASPGGRDFQSICQPLGCQRLLQLTLELHQGQLQLSYRLLSDKSTSEVFIFENNDPLFAANMLIDHALETLLSKTPERQILANSQDARANRDYALAVDSLYQGDPQSALDYLDLALARQPDFTWARIQRADALIRTYQNTAATELIDLLKQTKLTDRQEYALTNLRANLAYGQGDLEGALEIGEQLLLLSLKVGDQELIGNAQMNQGTAWQALGDLPKAVEYLQQSLNTYQQANLTLRTGQAHLNLGNAYWTGGYGYELATEHYQKAEQLFRSVGAQGYLSFAKHMLAGAKMDTGRFDDAKRELAQVRSLYQELGDQEGLYLIDNDLATIEFKEGHYSEAIELAQASFERAIDYSFVRAHASAVLALAHLYTGNFDAALPFVEERNAQDWFDPRLPYALIPALSAHANKQPDQALAYMKELRSRVNEQWNSSYQAWYDFFEQEQIRGYSANTNYAQLSQTFQPTFQQTEPTR